MFKVGDKVKVVRYSGDFERCLGRVDVIENKDGNIYPYRVKFDEQLKPGWNSELFMEHELEHYNPFKLWE